MPDQVAPPDYYYTDNLPELVFTTDLFTVEPTVCTVTYSCQILTGPRLDLCNVSAGATTGFFDTVNGSFTFNSIDMVGFEPGTYQMEVTGTSGLKSDKFTIDIVLVDPCFTVDLRM